MVERGWVHDYGHGHVAYSGPALRLARQVNEAAITLYSSAVLDVEDAHFPACVDHETLWKGGYVESHPSAVSFVANVVEDFDALAAYRVANFCDGEATMPPVGDLSLGGVCLTPAAYLPAFQILEGQVIGSGGRTISWLGRVLRYESRNVSPLDRLHEFDVREIIFVGTEDFVAERREMSLPLIKELAEMFDLDMSLQSDTDPSLASSSASKKAFQRTDNRKSEILLKTLAPHGEPNQLSSGVIDLHGSLSGERFNINTRTGAPAHSCSISPGIEHWVVAAFAQHGFDPQRWQEGLRGAIFN